MVEDCDDGVWFGVKYYDCKPGRGMFVHLSELKPAMRMMKVNEGMYFPCSFERIYYALIMLNCT